MKVLFVGAFPPADRKVYGGQVSSCRSLLRSSFPTRAELDLLDTTLVSNAPEPFVARLSRSVRRLVTFMRRVESNRPDAVLLFAGIGASLLEKTAMAWYARVRGVPSLLFLRGGAVMEACDTSTFTRWWVRLGCGGATMLMCQSPRWQEFAVRVLGFRQDHAPVIPNWTASPELLEAGAKRQSRFTDSPRILFVGWLDREKGVPELLEACYSLASSHKFCLELVGEGNVSDWARATVTERGLGEQITFSGWLDGKELLQAYERADIFVLPSWAEGLPNALIEAMASRLAIVVTTVGSVPDFLKHQEEALLIAPRQTAALTDAIQVLIERPELRARLADTAFEKARKEFTVEAAADRLIASLETVIAAPQYHPL